MEGFKKIRVRKKRIAFGKGFGAVSWIVHSRILVLGDVLVVDRVRRVSAEKGIRHSITESV
jgi:hypothetical protein